MHTPPARLEAGAPVVRSSCPPLPPGADHRGRTGRLLTAAAPQLSGWEGRARVSGACGGHGDSGAVVSGGREGGPYTLGRSQAVGDLRVWSRWVGPSHLHTTLRVPRGRSHENRRATSDPRKTAWNVPEPLIWTSDPQSPGKGLPLQNHKQLSAPQRKQEQQRESQDPEPLSLAGPLPHWSPDPLSAPPPPATRGCSICCKEPLGSAGWTTCDHHRPATHRDQVQGVLTGGARAGLGVGGRVPHRQGGS